MSAGCAAKQAPAQPREQAASETGLADAGWVRFYSKVFSLSLPLPQGSTWRIDDRSKPWLVAIHNGSKSMVQARVWRENAYMNAGTCEARALREWPALDRMLASVDAVDQRTLAGTPAQDFDSQLLVGLAPGTDGDIAGVASLFGASGRTCVAAVFVTEERQSAEQLAHRLELGSRMLEGLVLRSTLRPSVRESL